LNAKYGIQPKFQAPLENQLNGEATIEYGGNEMRQKAGKG